MVRMIARRSDRKGDGNVALVISRAVPKVENHVHLEGAIQPATLLHLAEANGVSLPATTEAGAA